MFKQIGKILVAKLGRQDELGKQLEIVKVFDLYRKQLDDLPAQIRDAEPVSLQNKILTVRARSSSHASELRLREQDILQNINHSLGKEMVRRVIYKH